MSDNTTGCDDYAESVPGWVDGDENRMASMGRKDSWSWRRSGPGAIFTPTVNGVDMSEWMLRETMKREIMKEALSGEVSEVWAVLFPYGGLVEKGAKKRFAAYWKVVDKIAGAGQGPKGGWGVSLRRVVTQRLAADALSGEGESKVWKILAEAIGDARVRDVVDQFVPREVEA